MSDVVERAKAALEGVTEGPWRWEFPSRGDDQLLSQTARQPYSNGYIDRDGNDSYPKSVLSGEWHNDDTAGIYAEDRDAAFIAQARELVPELVAEVERLDSTLFLIREARIDYDAALRNREHGVVAAQRFVRAVVSALNGGDR